MDVRHQGERLAAAKTIWWELEKPICRSILNKKGLVRGPFVCYSSFDGGKSIELRWDGGDWNMTSFFRASGWIIF